MQSRPDLGLFQLTEIGLRLIQNRLQRFRPGAQCVFSGQTRPVQLSEAGQHGCFKHRRSLRPEQPGLHQFIQQSFQFLQRTMQPCTTDGWHQVVKDHRLSATFRLGSLTGIVDDEGVEMGYGSEGECGAAARTQANPLTGKPFSTAVFPDMQHHLGSVLFTQPQVLGEVAMRWRQIGGMQISDLLRVVPPVRLQQNHHMTEAQTMDGKALPSVQIAGLIRGSPSFLDQPLSLRRHRAPPELIVSQRQMVQRWSVQSFRRIGAPLHQLFDQGIAALRTGDRSKVVALLIQPAEHVGEAGWGVEPNTIGHAPIPDRIVGQHHGNPPLRCRRFAEINPACGVFHQPVDAAGVGSLGCNRGGECSSRRFLLTEGTGSCGDATVQLGHHHLQRQIQGLQPPAAGIPVFVRSTAGQQLQDRAVQLFPQRAAQSSLVASH